MVRQYQDVKCLSKLSGSVLNNIFVVLPAFNNSMYFMIPEIPAQAKHIESSEEKGS